MASDSASTSWVRPQCPHSATISTARKARLGREPQRGTRGTGTRARLEPSVNTRGGSQTSEASFTPLHRIDYPVALLHALPGRFDGLLQVDVVGVTVAHHVDKQIPEGVALEVVGVIAINLTDPLLLL